MLVLSDKQSKNGWKQQIITFGNLNLPAHKSHNLHKMKLKTSSWMHTAQYSSTVEQKHTFPSFLFEVYAIKSSPTLPKTTYSLTICVCATRYSKTNTASLHWSKLQLGVFVHCALPATTFPLQVCLFSASGRLGASEAKNTRGERLGICVAFCRGKQQTCIWS